MEGSWELRGESRLQTAIHSRVLEGVAADEHLGVDVLEALADVGADGGEEAEDVEAELVGGAEGEAAHHGDQGEVDVEAGDLADEQARDDDGEGRRRALHRLGEADLDVVEGHQAEEYRDEPGRQCLDRMLDFIEIQE